MLEEETSRYSERRQGEGRSMGRTLSILWRYVVARLGRDAYDVIRHTPLALGLPVHSPRGLETINKAAFTRQPNGIGLICWLHNGSPPVRYTPYSVCTSSVQRPRAPFGGNPGLAKPDPQNHGNELYYERPESNTYSIVHFKYAAHLPIHCYSPRCYRGHRPVTLFPF